MAVLCSTQVIWPLPLVALHAVGRAWNPNVAKSRESGVFLPVGSSCPGVVAPCINAPGLSIRPPPVIRKHATNTSQNSGRGATERAGVGKSRQATATMVAAASNPGTRMKCLRCIMCVLPPPLLVRVAWMPHRPRRQGRCHSTVRKTRLIFRELGAFVARSRRRARNGFRPRVRRQRTKTQETKKRRADRSTPRWSLSERTPRGVACGPPPAGIGVSLSYLPPWVTTLVCPVSATGAPSRCPHECAICRVGAFLGYQDGAPVALTG